MNILKKLRVLEGIKDSAPIGIKHWLNLALYALVIAPCLIIFGICCVVAIAMFPFLYMFEWMLIIRNGIELPTRYTEARKVILK